MNVHISQKAKWRNTAPNRGSNPRAKSKISDSSYGLAIYDGRIFSGTCVEAEGQFTVFNADGELIGHFQSQKAAIHGLFQKEQSVGQA